MKNATWLNDEQSTEQETLVDERIESNGFNPFLEDDDPHALITQLKAEESNTRRTQFVDYLWAFIPLALMPFFRAFLMTVIYRDGLVESSFSYPYLILALMSAILAVIGWRRKSDLLQAHWLGRIPIYAFITFAFLFGDPFTPPQWVTAIGTTLLVGSLGWIGRLIYKHRHDHLNIAFMLLPILTWILGFADLVLIGRVVNAGTLGSRLIIISVMGIIVSGLGLGLFFLGRNRKTKWMGIFTPLLGGVLGSLIITGFAPSFAIPLWLGGLAVPAFFYWRERWNRPNEKQPKMYNAQNSGIDKLIKGKSPLFDNV